jgi:hypothetical protein
MHESLAGLLFMSIESISRSELAIAKENDQRHTSIEIIMTGLQCPLIHASEGSNLKEIEDTQTIIYPAH